MPDTDTVSHARKFLRGEQLKFAAANELWKRLKSEDQLSLARQVLRQLRKKPLCLGDGEPKDRRTREILCRQEALLTSKDPELDSATRHDEALNLLANDFEFIEDKKLGGDEETLGIAGGICKRRWNDLGQLKDLVRAAEFYERAAKTELGDDAYPHINAAFLEDLLAAAGDRPVERRERAKKLRERIQADLPVSGTWFNAATHAEALFGLGRYAEATEVLRRVGANAKPAPWELRTMAEQLAQLAYLREERPLEHPPIRMFFETLLPGASDAIRSVTIGKVGLALSGGGFRASFYHLGVLACLAERDVLRGLEVLSCVSGGSIVGACYWLKLRQRMLKPEPMQHESYVELVHELISHFQNAVGANLRQQVQPHLAQVIWLSQIWVVLSYIGALASSQIPAQAWENHPGAGGPGAKQPPSPGELRRQNALKALQWAFPILCHPLCGHFADTVRWRPRSASITSNKLLKSNTRSLKS